MYQTEIVPHDAIATPTTKIKTSHLVHSLSMEIFAQIGPMTHMRKAKREPRIPTIELNSGTAIEIATAIKVRRTRSMNTANLLNVVWHRT